MPYLLQFREPRRCGFAREHEASRGVKPAGPRIQRWSSAGARPRPSRLCSWTTRVTATPEARISRARVMVRSSSGRRVVRVEIFSEKARVTPAVLET